jgi:hypothetical protein
MIVRHGKNGERESAVTTETCAGAFDPAGLRCLLW